MASACVRLNFVTIKNLMGKHCGLLAEGDFGKVQSPVMETQVLCVARVCVTANLTLWPSPGSPRQLLAHFDPGAFALGCSSGGSPAEAPSLHITGFMTTLDTRWAGPHVCVIWVPVTDVDPRPNS